MSPNDGKADPGSSKAVESAQPINMILGQPRNTTSPSVVNLEKDFSYWSETPPQSSRNTGQAKEEMASQSAPVNNEEVATDKCAVCAGPPSHRCSRCAEGVDMFGKKSPTFYCGQECQRKQWTAHKIECILAVDRRVLYRIGSLLQWAFYRGREVTWHESVQRVMKVDTADGNQDPRMLVWRSKNQHGAQFAKFPKGLFSEEREKQAGLAHAAPGVLIVSGLMMLLGDATFSKAQMEVSEVAIRPKARRFAQFVARDPAYTTGSVCWVLRATLRDGSTFAIDVCNAQYAASTPEDALCGVFPWEQYMQRLSVSDSDIVNTQILGSIGNQRLGTKMTSPLASAKAGVMTAEDKQCSADIMAMMIQEVTSGGVIRPQNGVAIRKLMFLPSSDYDEEVEIFKALHERCLDIVGKKIAKEGALALTPDRFAAV